MLNRMSPEELAREREAYQARLAQMAASPWPSQHPQFSGLHMAMPRLSLGNGAYKVDIRSGGTLR